MLLQSVHVILLYGFHFVGNIVANNSCLVHEGISTKGLVGKEVLNNVYVREWKKASKAERCC